MCDNEKMLIVDFVPLQFTLENLGGHNLIKLKVVTIDDATFAGLVNSFLRVICLLLIQMQLALE